MPIAGFVRYRAHQVGVQADIATAATATRRRAIRGPIVINPNRTQPDVDEGSLDPVMAPYPTAPEVMATETGPAIFDELPVTFAAGLMGGVGPAANVWTYQVASLTADDFDYFTDEWGDDQNATDGIRAIGGVIDSLELGFGEDLAAMNLSENWVFSTATMGFPFTPGLDIDPAPIFVFGTDTILSLDPSAATIGTTPWTDTIHGMTFRVNNKLDKKRFANGSNTRFALSGYGRGAREIEFEILAAKTAFSMAEAITIDDDPVPDRFIEVETISPSIVTGATHYALNIRAPVRLKSKEDTEIGGNSVIRLIYGAWYEPTTLAYALKVELTTKLAALP